MNLWQVLLTGKPVEPLLDVLAHEGPERLATLHLEVRHVLRTLGEQELGEIDPARARAWVQTTRILAYATLPMGQWNERERIERAVAKALLRVEETRAAQARRKADVALRPPPPPPRAPYDAGTVEDPDVRVVDGRRFVRIKRGAGAR